MTVEPPIDFTVTPYHDGDTEEEIGRPVRPSFGPARLPAALWLGAAVLAVAANFLTVYRVHFEDSVGSEATEKITLSFDGWGRHHLVATNTDDFGIGLASGARWGWLFTAAAVLLVIAGLWSLRPRFQLAAFGPAELAAAASCALIGAVTAMVLSFQPDRHQLEMGDSPSRFHWGWCWPVELIAAVLGLVGWVLYRRLGNPALVGPNATEPTAAEPTAAESGTAESGEPDPPAFSSWSGPEPAASRFTDPRTENSLSDTTDRPHIPRGPGPSPW